MTELRPYQSRGLEEALAVEPGKRVLWCAPTGSGKGTVELAVLAALREAGRTAVLTTPSGEIARGFLDRLGAVDPAAEISEARLWALAEEAGIYSPVRLRNRLRKGLRAPEVLLYDENHHAVADGKVTGELLELVNGAAWLGWTATPYRGSHKETLALREFWGEPRVLLTIDEAAAEGYLSIPTPEVWPLLDDAGAKVGAGGEFDEEEIEKRTREGRALERLAERLAADGERWVAVREDGRKWQRPTLFAVASVALAREAAATLTAAGFPAEAVSGETPRVERDRLLARCRACEVALCQVQVLAEGVDLPWLRRLIDLRPLRSPVAWMQLLGRITRPVGEGEPAPEYVACCRNAERHGYLLTGQWPARKVAAATQEGFGGGRSGGGPLERGVAKDALRGRTVAQVPLLGGGAAELVHLGREVGWDRVEEVLVVGVPGEEAPRTFVREHRQLADGSREWGRWRVGPLDAAGYAGWSRPAPAKPLSEKQAAWWRSAASGKGLDPEVEISRQQFAILPALADARATLLAPTLTEERKRGEDEARRLEDKAAELQAIRVDIPGLAEPLARLSEAQVIDLKDRAAAVRAGTEVRALEIERQAAALAEQVRAVEEGGPLPATWAALREGGWGARVGGHAAAAVEPGRALRVRAKSGAEALREVARVVARGADWCLCEVRDVTPPFAASLPEGRYAVDDAGTLRFLIVGRRGQLMEQAGPQVFPVDPGRAARLAVLVAVDPREACARYGRELGICGRCGLALTNAESRAKGIGPVCEARPW